MVCSIEIRFAFINYSSHTASPREGVDGPYDIVKRSGMSRNRGLRSIRHMCGLCSQGTGHQFGHWEMSASLP
jgi:hypothetical protein